MKVKWLKLTSRDMVWSQSVGTGYKNLNLTQIKVRFSLRFKSQLWLRTLEMVRAANGPDFGRTAEVE